MRTYARARKKGFIAFFTLRHEGNLSVQRSRQRSIIKELYQTDVLMQLRCFSETLQPFSEKLRYFLENLRCFLQKVGHFRGKLRCFLQKVGHLTIKPT